MSSYATLGAVVAPELRAALRRVSLPSSSAGIIQASGGGAGLARRDLGLTGRRLPAKGSPDRLAYDALRQQYQRGKRAGLDKSTRDKLLARLRRAAVGELRGRLARAGRTRLVLHIKIDSPGAGGGHGVQDSRRRIVPASGPGILLHGGAMRAMLEALDAGDTEAVGVAFVDGVSAGDDGEAWGFLADPDEWETLEDVTIWPDGGREP